MSARKGNDIVQRAKPHLHAIESVNEEIESLKGTFMAACKAKRKTIKDLIKAAKDDGIAPPVMKGIVEQRKLQRKLDKIPADFDLDEGAAYRELARAFGPLGEAAASRAGFDQQEPTAEERKAAQQAADHEKGLKTIGRGERKNIGELMREPGGPLAGDPPTAA